MGRGPPFIGSRVEGRGSRVEGQGSRVWGLGSGVWGLGSGGSGDLKYGSSGGVPRHPRILSKIANHFENKTHPVHIQDIVLNN